MRSACSKKSPGSSPQLRVCLLPDWETLPYDQFSPHQDLVSERLATLYRIQRGDFDVAVVPASTALMRLCPPAYLAGHTFFLKQRRDASTLEALRRSSRSPATSTSRRSSRRASSAFAAG